MPHDDEYKQFNEEILDALGREPAPPEVYIEFGQAMGGVRASDALAELLCPGATQLPQMVETRPYQGSGLNPAAVEELIAEQEYAVPTHRQVPEPPRVTGDFWYFPLEALDTHPLKAKFRTMSGKRAPAALFKPRQAELSTFLRTLNVHIQTVPDWVELLVFASEPKPGPMWSTKDPPAPKTRATPTSEPLKRITVPDQAMQMVSFVIVACKQEPDGNPEIPEWLGQFCGPPEPRLV